MKSTKCLVENTKLESTWARRCLRVLAKNLQVHASMVSKILAECYKRTTPAWMTKDRTVLIKKNKSKRTFASNYRPITCLPLCWKILTALLTDEIYAFLKNNKFLPEEQKGCRRNRRSVIHRQDDTERGKNEKEKFSNGLD